MQVVDLEYVFVMYYSMLSIQHNICDFTDAGRGLRICLC